MKIYVGHPSSIDYEAELYPVIEDLREKFEHKFVLPHEDSGEPFDSRSFLEECDLMIAEVSEASTGLGIELGWADLYDVPIYCVHRKDGNISGSLPVVADNISSYDSSANLEDEICKLIESHI